jgi:hypothetical protein
MSYVLQSIGPYMTGQTLRGRRHYDTGRAVGAVITRAVITWADSACNRYALVCSALVGRQPATPEPESDVLTTKPTRLT